MEQTSEGFDFLGMLAQFPWMLIPVGTLFLWIGVGYIWNNTVRPRRAAQGIATASFNNILGRLLRFVFKEDKYPIMKKGADGQPNSELRFPKYSKLIVWRNLYAVGLILPFVLSIFKNSAAPWILGATVLIIATRVSKVFAARHNVLVRMFEVAASEMGYPREANLNPWGWVQITEWEQLMIPGETHVMFPNKYKAEEMRNRDNFERHFNGTVTDDNTWIYAWKSSKSMVTCSPVTHIPEFAPYPGSADGEWNKIPLGLGTDGELFWDVANAPMALVTGTTGGGKSTIQRNIIFHCIQHPDRWRFLGIDVKRVELSGFAKYEPVVMGIATDVPDGVEIIRYAKEEMEKRYQKMQDAGVNHFKDLPDKMHALMIMVDETFMFLSQSGIKTDEGKEEDALKGEASKLIGDIARLGRACGVHLILATQRPDATVIYGELKQNLAMRVAAGRADTIPSQMTLDNDEATRLPGHIKGRGYLQVFGEGEQFQGYLAPLQWIDRYINEDKEWLDYWAEHGKELDQIGEAPEAIEQAPQKQGFLTKALAKGKSKTSPNDSESFDFGSSDEKSKKSGLLGKINALNERASKRFEDEEPQPVATAPVVDSEVIHHSRDEEPADDAPLLESSSTSHEDLAEIAQGLKNVDESAYESFEALESPAASEPEVGNDLLSSGANESFSFSLDEFDFDISPETQSKTREEDPFAGLSIDIPVTNDSTTTKAEVDRDDDLFESLGTLSLGQPESAVSDSPGVTATGAPTSRNTGAEGAQSDSGRSEQAPNLVLGLQSAPQQKAETKRRDPAPTLASRGALPAPPVRPTGLPPRPTRPKL